MCLTLVSINRCWQQQRAVTNILVHLCNVAISCCSRRTQARLPENCWCVSSSKPVRAAHLLLRWMFLPECRSWARDNQQIRLRKRKAIHRGFRLRECTSSAEVSEFFRSYEEGWTSYCSDGTQSIYLSMYLSICLSVFLPFYLYICLCVYLSISLSICLSICLSIYLSVCLSFCLSICIYVYVSIYLSVLLSPPSICFPVCLSIWPPSSLAAQLSVHPIIPLSHAI
jgi:hypothetical protein